MYAIIDVGSNTVRMNIYKVEDNQLKLIVGKKESVGLASYVKNGQMMPEGIDRACEVLTEFHMILEDLKIENVHTFATAALRNCANSEAAVEEIKDRTGMDIEVISGSMEAELDFVGASHAIEVTDGLLIDIGGGSTELVVYKNRRIEKKVSLPIGSLNAYDRYVANILPSRAERKAIKQAVLSLLKNDPNLNYGEYPIVCGVGGTLRAARKLNNYLFQLPIQNTRVKAPNVKKMIKLLENEEMDAVPVETLDVLLKIVPDRVRTVLPGMIILYTVLKHFKSEWVEVTRAGVRDGYLYRYVLKADEEANPAEEAASGKEPGSGEEEASVVAEKAENVEDKKAEGEVHQE
jgi:exopolyphosphatase/guanosine-5'-triphosphate,3'-diphosphate pyrophosphatase